MEIKYNKIGIDYNQTRSADGYLVDKILNYLDPDTDKLYLDIGCGTGNYTIALHNKGVQIMGIDPSEKMLSEAKIINNLITWRLGTAENTNINDERIDGIICSLTIHHWTNLQMGFMELSRILKPRGRLIIFTSTPSQMDGYWLNHYFPIMLSDSKKQMPSFQVLKAVIQQAGLSIVKKEKYFVPKKLVDHFLYCGKNKPDLYLRSDIRNGISSFSDLANQQEIEIGLRRLKRDIDEGNIQNIINRYENTEGDYLFIIAKKINANNQKSNNLKIK